MITLIGILLEKHWGIAVHWGWYILPIMLDMSIIDMVWRIGKGS